MTEIMEPLFLIFKYKFYYLQFSRKLIIPLNKGNTELLRMDGPPRGLSQRHWPNNKAEVNF